MTAALRLQNVTKRFGGLTAINNVSFDIPAGTLSAIIGPNGAGKTTLFNIITGHLKPDAGQIWLDGTPLLGRSSVEVTRLGVGRAFQVASLFQTFTVQESIAAAVAAHKRRLANVIAVFPDAEVRDRAGEVMRLVGLDAVRNKRCDTLSHGDQKLLDIALALALEPRVLLLDEPTAGMGRDERWSMIDCVYRLWEQVRMTLIFIEHDMDIVFKIAQTVRVLRQGAKLAEGGPEEVRNNPAVIEAYLGSELQ